nr:DUF2946 family protein [uncultured Hyphomonas sp.]
MSLLCALALVAMVVRGLIPSGYMLASAEQPGQFVNIVICHGDGAGNAPAVLDLKTGKLVDPADRDGKPDPGKSSSCPYAMTAHFALPELVGPVSYPVQTDISFRPTLTSTVPGRGLAAPPPPARGPPQTI